MPPQLNIYACVTVVAYTLLSYDYALTIAQEIEVFWQRPKRSWTFALFVVNRYVTIFGHVPQLKLDWTIVWVTFLWSLQYSDTNRQYSDTSYWVSQIVVIVIQITGGVLIFLVVLMFVGTIVGCAMSSASPVHIARLNRLTVFDISQGYQAAAWTGQLVFDFVVFLLTLIRSLQIRKERSQSIIDIFLRDGSLYFAVMCGANIANIIILLNSLKALGLGNIDFKAYVEHSGSEGNRSNGFIIVFIVACKHDHVLRTSVTIQQTNNPTYRGTIFFRIFVHKYAWSMHNLVPLLGYDINRVPHSEIQLKYGTKQHHQKTAEREHLTCFPGPLSIQPRLGLGDTLMDFCQEFL
ncbi:hypothetical protein J3A83DRAFT_4186544 [Scleroderma citrinum]